MKAFVTGGSGFIGTHLINFLLSRKWKIKALFHKSPINISKNEIEIIKGDVRDLSLLEKFIEKGDIVIHLASALGASLISGKEFFEINAEGTRNVLMACLRNGAKRVIHFSSAGVIGHVKRGEIADENYPLNPEDFYERSKLEGEKIAVEYGRKGLDVIIIRPGWVYGPGDKRTFKLIKAIASGKFFIIGKGLTTQTPIYIDDLVEGVYLCLQKGLPGEIYNLAGLEILSVKEMAEIIAESLNKRIFPIKIPVFIANILAWSMDRSYRIFNQEAPLTPSKIRFFTKAKSLSIDKARKELGFYPKTSFRNGIEKTISWYKKNGWL
ncbi:NAD-dependent epimerase/dehydratase family protein [Candidatus Aminicenantes bacterium AC-708-M15]|jgi:dihydroflavonol-4-reductase|nr:NAD-dependent epimerase/dehydratase family protein [SCandidatus Aminicenantes bacterium Aminicenantia_JdfR_composite]MCP2596372.1 NAD-dependent epimerase/dehydratase family protein [Candidatus Aminicenantes bacterium AC-335-G13]MCP2604099.1 NAD-dependent epimerase/dehydratase family protein [Candidatus Aminicenantes bacterium AC-708-M15]MCP2605388.1 NAD-dependent epimerase/dehydratase family protein [Candidatus Aminicenantes bacterium AC-335-O07]MCP2606001.1 NAD-dependent epimerase/dehydrata